MNLSYKWLKSHIDCHLPVEELKDVLTFAGIEVEAVNHPGAHLQGLVVAKIQEHRPHPGSDHLSLCQVFDGTSTYQVVCGAPNCRAGQTVALATVGTKLGEITIKKAKLRGEESNGMLCSERELGLSDKHEGIMVLDDSAIAGTPIDAYLGLDDVVFELEITPNRPDLLGVIGIARDLAAILRQPWSEPVLPELPTGGTEVLPVTNRAEAACPVYTGRLIRNVKVAPSPLWLQQRLTAAGLRPINNIVDITNFVMLEYGHPLHAFDYACLNGGEIIVRQATNNEEFTALNGVTYKLTADDLVIADRDRPVALAGIMGGEESGISNQTVDIVLEAALFNYSGIRRSVWRHKINSDSSYRFERGMARSRTYAAGQAATALILELAGGELSGPLTEAGTATPAPWQVDFRPARIKKLLGLEPGQVRWEDHLSALGLTKTGGDSECSTWQIPDFRPDLTREADLLEEVMRLHGYNDLPPVTTPTLIMSREDHKRMRSIKTALVEQGWYEAINLSFFDPNVLDKLELADADPRRQVLMLLNPQGPLFAGMRPTLLGSLLQNALYNINYGITDFCLFESGTVFSADAKGNVTETARLTGLATGKYGHDHYTAPAPAYGWSYLKGAVETILTILRITNAAYTPTAAGCYQPGMAATITVDGNTVGEMGLITPSVASRFGLEAPVWMFDLDQTTLLKLAGPEKPFAPADRFLPVRKDISFVVDKSVNWADLQRAILAVNREIIRSAMVFDEYTGKGVPQGSRSLAVALTLCSTEKTLTDANINQVLESVLTSLKKIYGIESR